MLQRIRQYSDSNSKQYCKIVTGSRKNGVSLCDHHYLIRYNYSGIFVVELKFIMPNNSTTVQLLLIMEMHLFLGETMEFLPHNTNTNDIGPYFYN